MRFLSNVCIITEDVPGLARFYMNALNVTAELNDVHIEIPLDGGVITLYSKAAAERDMGFDFTRYHGTGMVKTSFAVKDVDAEYERLKTLDTAIEFMTPPTTYPWGARSMHFRDPDGNIVCFVSRPEWA